MKLIILNHSECFKCHQLDIQCHSVNSIWLPLITIGQILALYGNYMLWARVAHWLSESMRIAARHCGKEGCVNLGQFRRCYGDIVSGRRQLDWRCWLLTQHNIKFKGRDQDVFLDQDVFHFLLYCSKSSSQPDCNQLMKWGSKTNKIICHVWNVQDWKNTEIWRNVYFQI